MSSSKTYLLILKNVTSGWRRSISISEVPRRHLLRCHCRSQYAIRDVTCEGSFIGWTDAWQESYAKTFRMLLTQEVGFYVRKYRRCNTDRFPCIIAYSSLGQNNKGSARLHITIALTRYISHCKKTQCQLKQ